MSAGTPRELGRGLIRVGYTSSAAHEAVSRIRELEREQSGELVLYLTGYAHGQAGREPVPEYGDGYAEGWRDAIGAGRVRG